jgi:23S rRNA G2445 N2-methylase RlmL
MAPRRLPAELPPCYAIVQLGLEELAAEEIAQELGGEIKKHGQGVVVFRVPEIDRSLFHLKTTEDIFLLAWGTDQLSYRASDLDSIRRWTAHDANWDHLLKLHHGVRPKPKGRPSYWLVVQMTGEHGYRRIDAMKALGRGLAGKLPASWREAQENASVEVWLTIHGAMAVCGLRLSDRTMRHRTYKLEHLPASLRPTVAAAMVRLADLKPGQSVLDPMCGAGTILAEALLSIKGKRDSGGGPWQLHFWGGDIDRHHVRAAGVNLRSLGNVQLQAWDARKLPLEDASIDRILSNPPFGKQLSTPEAVRPLYRAAVAEMDRVLRPGGIAVLLVADVPALREAVQRVGWRQKRLVNVRVLGQRAAMVVWRKESVSLADRSP